MGHTGDFRVCSISPQPFLRFSLNITQMFLSGSWCAEPMTQLHRLKVTVQGHGFYPCFNYLGISPLSLGCNVCQYNSYFCLYFKIRSHFLKLVFGFTLISEKKTKHFVSFSYVNCVEYIICIAINKEEKVKKNK